MAECKAQSRTLGARAARSRRAFTVIELGVVLVIIVLLVALVMGAVAIAYKNARVAGERRVLVSLKVGVEQFNQQFGFLPPLLKDDNDAVWGPVVASTKTPVIYTHTELVSPNQANQARTPKYSVCSLAYYLIGATDKETDGVDGPGFTQPDKRTGVFSRTGATRAPLFDATRDRSRLFRAGNPGDNGHATRVTIVDRWHSAGDKTWVPVGASANDPKHPTHAIRYYRWEPQFYSSPTGLPPGKKLGDVWNHNVPAFIGDPDKQPELRSARFAIVSAGPDGLIVDDPADPDARPDSGPNKDNIIEVGP